MHAYLGITCHILINREIISYLLACRQIFGAHTGENILADFEEIAGDFRIKQKIFKAITDKASNMKKAFQPISLLGFVLADDESEDEDDNNESSGISIEECEEQDQDLQLDNLERISCFAHTLQLCVKDGINASRQITKAIAKVAHIVNHVKKSTKATEKLESLFKKVLISKNETRWNSQLKMVRRAIEVDVNEVVKKREFHLSAHEKSILREFVQILQPFEDATDILQGQKYASICLVIPTYIGLKTNLEKANETRHCQDLIKTLTESLAKTLGHVVTHSLYCISTFLDPHFKLKWCSSEAQRIAVKSMIFEKLSTLSASSVTVTAVESTAENTDKTTPPAPKKTKIDRLFSFMENTETEGEATGIEEEYEAYLNSLVPQLTEKTA